MDVRRFADLFAAEAGEHLRLLNRAVLALESSGSTASLEEAFRSVHTIKGLAATMGYRRVTTLSHTLEDLLDELRAGRTPLDERMIDGLLKRADALEAAVAVASAGGDSGEPSPGAVRLAHVRLRRDAQLKSARALLVVRAAERAGFLAGHEPATFDDDFDGNLLLRLVPGADESAAELALRAAGDVDSVAFDTEGAAVEAPEPSATTRTQHMRVERRRLDDVAEGIGELSVLYTRLEPGVANGSNVALNRIGAVLAELQRAVMAMRMVPLAEVFDRFPRLVRDGARALGKDVELRIEGGDIEVDRGVAEEVREPLVHLLRNAVDHGIESAEERARVGKNVRGKLVLRVARERSSVRIDVIDDGAGVDAERIVARAKDKGLLRPDASAASLSTEALFRLLSSPGFSTAERVTEVSGRGVGLDAVVTRIRALGGAIDMSNNPGGGTTFTLRLPITLAIAQALSVRIGGEDYAIALTHVREAVELDGIVIPAAGGRQAVQLRDEVLPLIRLRHVLRIETDGEERAAIVAEVGERRVALAVDELVGREQILVKSFDAPVGTLRVFSGVTLLADGRPALIVDPISVILRPWTY
jgi:two-component system chemotaxis sensor kinase CheA